MSAHDHEEHHHHEAPAAVGEQVAPAYWSTLEQYYNTPEYQARRGEEFYPEAKPQKYFDKLDRAVEAEPEDPAALSMHRRTFLKLGGFAALLAAVQGCERPAEKIVAHANPAEEQVPGLPLLYSSTCMECAATCGVVVKSREGRPTKLEGNVDHAVNKGALCSRGQASLMTLYNPDRAQKPVELSRGTGAALPATLEAVDKAIAQRLTEAKGRIVLLSGTMHGPTSERLLADFRKVFPTFEHVMYDALHSGAEREAYKAAYGADVLPRFLFDRAETLVLLGGDPIGEGISKVEYQRLIAKRRAPGDGMSRIFAFEPVPTVSGAYADYRYRVRPQQLVRVGLALAGEVYKSLKGSIGGSSELATLLADASAEAVERETGIATGTIAKVAARLVSHAGKSLVYSNGTTLTGAAGRALALVCALLNDLLGNNGRTVDFATAASNQQRGSHAAMLGLIESMKAGEVGAVLIYNVNPAYTLPPAAGFAEALKNVGTVVTMSLKLDETASLGDYHVPTRHWLESWGDAEPIQGLYSIVQPQVKLPWQVRQLSESLAAIATAAGSEVFIREIPHPADAPEDVRKSPLPKRTVSAYEYVRESWRGLHEAHAIVGTFDQFWDSVLRHGILDRSAESRRNFESHPAGTFNGGALEAVRGGGGAPAELNLVLHASIIHGDGESMGNPWLLETPDPVTKVCWDNYAGLSVATAKKLDVTEGDWIRIKSGGTTVDAPVWVWPGVDDGTIALMLGWGRRRSGDVGNGIGFDFTPLASVDGAAKAIAFNGMAATVEKITDGLGERNKLTERFHQYNISVQKALAGSKYPFANSQGHNYLEGRPIFFETTLHQLKNGEFESQEHIYNHWYTGKEKNDFKSMWGREHKYAGHHWGMTIDYNLCSGCGACITACQAENNIPVVGKVDVIKGREMHWIRIDRYYRGDLNNPDHAMMAMLCQHCATAPCETVCPVVATLHNDEGLNTMIYNRCVGTRYCSNNCPYKVRRFNWHQYTDYRTGFNDAIKRVTPLEMLLNPDVTVRTRGVMEKCTFCVHRIKRAKETARLRGTAMVDGEMLTACQQTCPAQAIVFGDRNDKDSMLMRETWNDERSYSALGDLNTQPAIRYLALARNRDEDVPHEYLGKHGLKAMKKGEGGEHHGSSH